MTATSDIKIDWQLTGDRVATVKLAVGSDLVELNTTYVHDSFSSLIQAAVDMKIGSASTYALLAGEPAGSIIFFSRRFDQIRIEVVSFSAISAAFTRFSSGALRWRGAVERDSFIEAVRNMGDAAREKYGDVAFSRSWGHPFPTEKMAMLR